MRVKAHWQPLFGSLLWLCIVVAVRPAPKEVEWGITVLLLAPLVLIPLGLRLATYHGEQGLAASFIRMAILLQPWGALLFASSFCPAPGIPAAFLVLPWLATCGLISLAGSIRIWKRGLLPWNETCLDAGLIYVSVGAGWAVISRAGLQPLGFEPVIVLLTAIHFHYAGFTLPILTGLAARSLAGRVSQLAAVGVIAGVPLVAVGITATQLGFGPFLECAAAILTSTAGLLVAVLHFQLAGEKSRPLAVRALWTIAALSLTAGMLLAGLYGCRAFLPVAWLDIPWMRALHGTANGLGFGLAGMLGWTAAMQYRIANSQPIRHFA